MNHKVMFILTTTILTLFFSSSMVLAQHAGHGAAVAPPTAVTLAAEGASDDQEATVTRMRREYREQTRLARLKLRARFAELDVLMAVAEPDMHQIQGVLDEISVLNAAILKARVDTRLQIADATGRPYGMGSMMKPERPGRGMPKGQGRMGGAGMGGAKPPCMMMGGGMMGQGSPAAAAEEDNDDDDDDL